MENETETKKYCKKITYKSQKFPVSIIFGIITFEDNHFITLKTAKRFHTISKDVILSIEDSFMEFKEEKNDINKTY